MKLTTCILLSALATTSAQAVLLTGGSLSSSVSAAGVGGSSSSVGVFAQNTATTSTFKYIGDIDISSTTGGDSLGNFLNTSGNVELAAGEAFGLSYDFSATITGGGTLNFTVTATTDFGGDVDVFTNSDTLAGPGTDTFNFSVVGDTATESIVGTWTGALQFDWVGATPGSTLNITIPGNSIDFTAGDFSAVPEPSQYALVGLVGLSAFALRMRKRKQA